MPTARENVKKFFLRLRLIHVLTGIIIGILLSIILPYDVTTVILFFILTFSKEIGYVLLVLLFMGTVYWLMKDKQTIKKKAYILLSLPFIGYILASCFVYFMPSIYGDCDFYNAPDTLNAGIKTFNGKIYKVQVCGTGGNDQSGTDDELELQVFSQEGELLAKRHYSVNWYSGGSFHEPLQYTDNSITYNPANQDEGKISIPPTKLDWIFARIPFLN